jgi:hypothetical protein
LTDDDDDLFGVANLGHQLLHLIVVEQRHLFLGFSISVQDRSEAIYLVPVEYDRGGACMSAISANVGWRLCMAAGRGGTPDAQECTWDVNVGGTSERRQDEGGNQKRQVYMGSECGLAAVRGINEGGHRMHTSVHGM